MRLPVTPPPVCFTAGSGRIWAEVVNHLSGYVVTVVLLDGTDCTGELLGDGETGRFLRLMTNSRERTFLARSVKEIKVL